MLQRAVLPLLLAAVCAVAAPLRAQGDPLLVFAAVSLADALGDCATAWSAATAHTAQFNFGASSTLALQIQAGAPADVFVSADDAKMDSLEAKQLLLPGTRRALLSNRLVVVVPVSGGPPVRTPTDLLQSGVRRIALGEPQSVPAGIYAKASLESAGLWAPLRHKLVPVENVRAALAAVESGNVDAGFVYRTDARLSARVRVAYEIPAAGAPRILYPAAILAATHHAATARSFLNYLQSDAARAVFQQYGFGVVTPTATPPPAAGGH